jgi:uncharacterized protein (TIGR00661 family)
MKVLYGVQGTGNGHITRARAMATAMAAKGIEVDWVFSGRERSTLFDMECFGDFQCFRGLTFQVSNGRIDMRRTMNEASMAQLWRDSRTLSPQEYDLVLTDFEPTVAWAARARGVPCIGIGHQYAFAHDIPRTGHSVVSEAIMRWFAPVTLGLGVHWHHFDNEILPPIIEPVLKPEPGDLETVLIYLPFENSQGIIDLLKPLKRYRFIMHCVEITPGLYGNTLVRGFSRDGFKESLHECGSVVCNAGFELTSEALALGKRILVKPLQGQMEQSSNATALEQLGLGQVMPDLSASAIAYFLATGERQWVHYPDVAGAIVDWLQVYPSRPLTDLVAKLWQEVRFSSAEVIQAA